MRRIINSTFVSLDGMVERLEDWHFDYHDDEASQVAMDDLAACDAMLMGRATYEVYASAWPGRPGDYADGINAMAKYVASRSLEQASWKNTSILRGDLATEVARLKAEPGQDILMHGYGPVARTLLTHGLLDELRLWVHPVLSGGGEPGDLVFRQDTRARLRLVDVRTLGTGVVILSYQPSVGV